MKTINFAIAITILLSGQALFAKKAEVDTDKSRIEWHGKKIGGDHMGNIRIMSGSLEFSQNGIANGDFVIDMTTITNSDIENEGYNQKLVDHLKSDDFFGVEKYPTAGLVITGGSEFNNGKASVKGDLTIKGKTQPIEFDVERREGVYTATIDIDRSKFNVRYGSDTFFDNLGDKAIDDIFTLKVELFVK